MTMAYRLHYAPDNASLIVRLALEEIGVPYETVLVDRSIDEQKSSRYLALNPNGLIPVLETHDGVIFETAAILLWLADQHEELAPPPKSADRANFLKWLFFVSNTIHPAMRMMFYPECYVGAALESQKALRQQMRKELTRYLDMLEEEGKLGRYWLAADRPSVLDFYICCALRWIALYPKKGIQELEIGNWPILKNMAARLECCKSVKAAINAEGLGPNPFTMPDYPTPPEGSAT